MHVTMPLERGMVVVVSWLGVVPPRLQAGHHLSEVDRDGALDLDAAGGLLDQLLGGLGARLRVLIVLRRVRSRRREWGSGDGGRRPGRRGLLGHWLRRRCRARVAG